MKGHICKAAIAIKGEWFGCDEPNLTHPIHGSGDGEVIWVSHDELLALPRREETVEAPDVERSLRLLPCCGTPTPGLHYPGCRGSDA